MIQFIQIEPVVQLADSEIETKNQRSLSTGTTRN